MLWYYINVLLLVAITCTNSSDAVSLEADLASNITTNTSSVLVSSTPQQTELPSTSPPSREVSDAVTIGREDTTTHALEEMSSPSSSENGGYPGGNETRKIRIDEQCDVGYGEIGGLAGRNITDDVMAEWPCELRQYWKSLDLFRRIDSALLSYGTVTIVLMGIICNMVALRTLTNSRMRYTTSHMYLSALAIFDTGNLLFNFLVGVLRGQSQEINSVFQGSEALCMIHSVFVELFNLLGPWIIVCFTVERFICVHYPLKVSTLCSHRKARNTIIGVTLFIFAFSCHKLLVSGFEGDSVFGYKACKTNRIKSGEIIYFYVALSTWLPSLAIMFLNFFILIRVRRSSKERRHMASTNSRCETNRSKHQENKLTSMLLVVSSAYLILVIPLGVLQSAEITWKATHAVDPSIYEPQRSLYVEFMSIKFLLKCIRTLCFFFYQLNFAINFFLYLLSGDKFREVLKRQYSCCHAKHRGFTSSTRATGSDELPPGSSMDSIPSKVTSFSVTSTDGRH